MFIHVETHYKCSKCKAIDRVEFVTRENKTFKKCIACGHESLYSTLTVSPGEFVVYNQSDCKNPIEF